MMKKVKKLLIMLMCFSILIPSGNMSAHSGRTDASGGHHDYKDKSGLGSYHYHCGGHPAHLHTNGVCPYDTNVSQTVTKKTTKKVSKYYKVSTVKKVQKKLNRLGYQCGKPDGIYGTKTKNAIKKFQKAKKISVNGKINRTLLKKLKIKI